MNTKELKSQIHKGTERMEHDVAAVAASIHNGTEALGKQRDDLEHTLHDVGHRLAHRGRTLAAEASTPANLRTLALLATTLVAGFFVLRSLRH